MMKKLNFLVFILTLTIMMSGIVLAVDVAPEEQINAVLETARAYYRQGAQLQYDSFRKNLNSTPEDATSKHTIYTVCSGFTFQTYYQALGIKIPDTTEGLLDYARDNVESKENVLMYYGTEKSVYSKNVLGTKSTPNYSEFVKKIAKVAKPGDIFVVTGHAMFIESVDKKEGKVTILEGAFNGGGRYDVSSHSDEYEENGAIKRINLENKLKTYYNRIGDGDAIERICLIRIITDGKTYIDINNQKATYDGITPAAKSRLEYSNIDIGKIVTITSESQQESQSLTAKLNDVLTYQITVRNKDSEKYTKPIEVIELIDENLILVDDGDGELNNNQLKWTIKSLDPGKNVKFTYKVKVPHNPELYGKIIVSEGMVANIKNTRIETMIGNKLRDKDQAKLVAAYNKVKSGTLTEREFINNIYNEAFGLDLGLVNLNNLDIITFNSNNTEAGMDKLNVKYTNLNDTEVKKYVYGNFYGLRIAADANESEKLVKASRQWNSYPKFELNDRARTLTKEMLDEGDILLVRTGKKNNTDKNLVDKSYIFLQDKLIRKVSKTEFEILSGNDMNTFLRNIVCDNYILLRPALQYDKFLETEKNYFVDGEYHETLEEACNAISCNEGKIKVMKDCVDKSSPVIAKDKIITIELNGKTITKKANGITNNGTVIIEENGTIKTLSNGENKIRFLITNKGTLTIKNGCIESSGIESDSWYTIYSPEGTVNLNGGSVKAMFPQGRVYDKLASAINVKNKLNINGGRIESVAYGVFAYDTTATIKMTGGTIIADKNALYVKGEKTKGSVQILGGVIESTKANGIVIEKNTCSLTIGKSDETLNAENPLIKAKKIAVSNKNTSGFKFYDGKLLSESDVVYDGKITTKKEYKIKTEKQTQGKAVFLEK